jgi:NAD(P)-dependent dehydrogenase (short-subunit alcohol dehydrogenase family)
VTASSILSGRRAVVTGAGRGIGRSVALALAREGADLVLLARSEDALRAVARQARGAGVRAQPVACDVADAGSVERALARAGPVDVLVNNAAVVGPVGSTLGVDLGAWRHTLDINLVGALACIQATVPGMVDRGWGRVVNVSTGGALGSGMPEANAYAVSKAALDMLTLNLADELAGSGVTVNLVRPGTTETDMQTDVRSRPLHEAGPRLHAMFKGFHERGELHSPELPARLILALLKGDSTGEAVNIYDDRGRELVAAAG